MKDADASLEHKLQHVAACEEMQQRADEVASAACRQAAELKATVYSTDANVPQLESAGNSHLWGLSTSGSDHELSINRKAV